MTAPTVVAGRYELADASVLGSMGELFEGYDRLLDRRVAVKRIQPGLADDPEVIRRFDREARLTARVSHPGVPAVYDTGHDADGPYLVLEYIDGRRLDELRTETGPLDTAWTAAIGAQIAAVLAHTHAVSLIHRDLNPANIMLRPTGAVAVIDFGVAALTGTSRLTTLTGTGQVVGTAAYQAPERRLGVANPLTDLYALGKILTAMTVPGGPLDALAGALTAPRPADRPASARDVVERLIPLIGDLRPLPGSAADGRDVRGHVRAYAAGIDTAAAALATPPRDADLHADAAHLRRYAERLSNAGQVRRATGVLDQAIMLARGTGDLVLTLRWDRARYLATAGDHEQAATELLDLSRAMHTRLGAAHPAVVSARTLYADLEAARGRTGAAVTELRALTADLSAAYGPHDVRLHPLRRQLGIQLAVTGDTEAAREILTALEHDQRTVLSPHDPELAATRDVLATL